MAVPPGPTFPRLDPRTILIHKNGAALHLSFRDDEAMDDVHLHYWVGDRALYAV